MTYHSRDENGDPYCDRCREAPQNCRCCWECNDDPCYCDDLEDDRPTGMTPRFPPTLARRVEALIQPGERAVAEQLVTLAEMGAVAGGEG